MQRATILLVATLLMLPAPSAAQTDADLTAAALVAMAEATPEPILTGLVFLDSLDDVQTEGWSGPLTAKVDVSRVPLVDHRAIRPLLESAVGASFNMIVLERLRGQIAQHYASIGSPFVRVIVPAQDATNGVVQIVVVEGRLGRVRVEGRRWFSEAGYVSAVGAKQGEIIDAKRFERRIDSLNSGSFRHVTPIAIAGEQLGTTDVVLQVRERFPVAASATVGNTGNPRNGEVQIGTSVDWGNAFGRGDLATVRYTTSSDRVINQYGAAYTTHLPWRDVISVNGSYAQTRPDAAGSLISNVGTTSGAGLRYVMSSLAAFERLAFGVDWKRTNNDVLFGGESIFTASTTVAQLVAETSRSIATRAGLSSLGVSAVFSPGNLVDGNTDEVFATQREGATARYAYGRFLFGHASPLPWGFSAEVRATLQIANARLLSSEQLGFGGDGSVRAFNSFAANRDEGAIVNAELQWSAFGGVLTGTRGEAGADALSLFAFVDYGAGRQHGEDAGPLSLASAGPGLRYRAGRFGTLQLSYGYVLRKTGLPEASDGRLHFQVQAIF